jgi:diguanylate cyclase (GGDEF)-like protein
MLFLDTTMWVAVGAAIGSAVIALALSLVLLVLLRSRRQRKPDADVERMLRESDERFEQMLESLSRELERARKELRRSHRLTGLAATIDLDALGERILDAALGLPGVDAATLAIPRPGEESLIATAGMSREEADRQALPPTPETGARAVGIAYRYPESTEPDENRIYGGLAVPLAGEDSPVGTLAVFWRGREHEPSEQVLASLEELAVGAGPAVENAIRYRDASRLADLDALTGLHNRRYFHDTLGRECARAARYDRELALLLFDVDDFKAINDRLGHLAADTVLAQLAERVRSVVRSSDVPCRVGGDEFAVILPEASLADAEQLYRRLQFAVGNAPTGPVDRLHISAGLALLRPGDNPVAFFERADEALYRAKEGGKGQAIAATNGIEAPAADARNSPQPGVDSVENGTVQVERTCGSLPPAKM